jgi:hypothetical protein
MKGGEDRQSSQFSTTKFYRHGHIYSSNQGATRSLDKPSSYIFTREMLTRLFNPGNTITVYYIDFFRKSALGTS